MFMAALLVVTPNCKQLKCLTIGDQLSTQWHIHISESYLAIKRNGLHIDTQNNLDGFQGHYAEIKTLIIRRLILYYFIYITSFLRKIFIFRERIWEGEREGDKHQSVVASHAPPTGDLAHNPGMCPDCDSNEQLFGSQADKSTEPHQPWH